jgi:hypothetical protein
MWVDKTGIAEMSNLVELGRTLNQRDSRKGNSDYYPHEIGREGISGGGGNGTGIGYGAVWGRNSVTKRKRVNEHVSFTERGRTRNKRVNRMRDGEESSGREEIVHAHSRGCIVRDIVKR